jgi:hypothetical protein
MKIKYLNFVKGLLVLFIGLSSLMTLGQNPRVPSAMSSISIAPDVSGLSVGDIVHVDIKITTATEPSQPIVSAILKIKYDQGVLVPLGPNGITAVYGSSTYSPFFNTTMLAIIWESPSLGDEELSDQTIATLNFIYIGGTTSTTMEFNTTAPNVTSFSNVAGDKTFPGSYTNKIISGAGPGTYNLHSKTTGGIFNWNNATSWVEGLTPSSASNVFITGAEMQISYSNIVKSKCINLTIYPAGKLTVKNDISLFSVAGNMVIQGDATSTGSFVDLGITTVAGTTTVARVLDGNWVPGNTTYKSHLISSPVRGQSNALFYGSLMNIWNEPAQNWDPLTLPYITMKAGKGYAVAPLAPGITATFSGKLNTGDTIANVTNAGTGTWSGYNLVGNPYPSAINWNSSVVLTNVGTAAWVWNGGNYIANDQGTGLVIAAEQGFFVRATAAGTVKFTNAARTHGGTFYKSSVSDLLTLKVSGNDYWDQTQIAVKPMATAGYDDMYDAMKFPGSPEAPQFYSMLPVEQLSINALPDLNGTPLVQLGFKAGSSNIFTITADGIETFASNTEFFLEDLVANKVQNLRVNPVYIFSAAPGQVEHRFNLHFAPVGIQESPLTSGIKIYSAEKSVYVNISTDMKGIIVVYNMLGREIARADIQSLSINKINLDVPSGFYLVKVDGDSNTSTGKVFIK